MARRKYINTIQDLEDYYYGGRIIEKAQWITKDDPVKTTTTGVYNAVYGQQVWAQLNQEANAFGCLPKYPWERGGWRIITARAAASGGGVAENAALPATIKPTFAEIEDLPKTVAHTFDVSEVQEYLAAESADDAFGAMAHMRPIMGLHHKEMINTMLLADVDTLASNNIESLDRVTLSEAARSALGITDGDQDMHGIDRGGNTIYDPGYCGHNSGTDRIVTDDLLRTAMHNLGSKGANTSVIITGHDTKADIDGLFEAAVRYQVLGEATIKVGVNGIQTQEGFGYSVKAATYQGIPIIISKNVETDTISRIHFLDTTDPEGFGKPRLGIMVAKPTQYFEAGMLTGNPFGIDRLGTEGMFRTMAELICRNFQSQGSIRDLK